MFTLIEVSSEGSNALVPILVTFSGIVTEVSGQENNALLPIVVKFDSEEIFIEVRFVHPENAASPIVCKVVGSVILVKLEQLPKAT